jgi:phage-related holin
VCRNVKEEFYEIILGAYQYIIKVFEYVKPLWVVLYAAISFVLFPDSAYIPPTIGLIGALVMDVITKYYAISKKNGGFRNAIKTRKISSESMWRGTKKKLVSILVVMICCGLLLRFTSFLPQIAITITTVCYGFMFFRELQSIAENMIDAGHDDMKWFLTLIKRKQREVLDITEDEETVTNIEVKDEEAK